MSDDKNRRDELEGPPSPPELRTRRGISGVVASRDAEQGAADSLAPGAPPGIGGSNVIAQRAMDVEHAIGAFAQVIPDPAPIMQLVMQFRAVAAQALQSASAPGQATPMGGQLAGIVAPPAHIAAPAMQGPGQPPPPLM